MQQSTSQTLPPTIAEELDRLEIIAGKIGLISQDRAFALLKGLDSAHDQISSIAPDSASRRIAETQFETILSKLRAESVQFLRDLGGIQALQQARKAVDPPVDHSWWYLDELVTSRRKSTLKRLTTTAGIVLVVLLILVFIYQRFLAPDPQFVAVYGHEQTARDLMVSGDLQTALDEAEKGLAINPEEVSLLLMKGVIEDSFGNTAEADASFAAARRILANDANFYVARGQTYTYINQFDKALSDAQQAVALDSQSGEAYLLMGNIYEFKGQKPEAFDAYNAAYRAAEARGELELAALARTRIAFMIQSGSGYMPPVTQETATP